MDRILANRDAAGQRVDRKFWIGAAKGYLRDVDCVTHGLVPERELRVEMLDSLRYGDAARSDRPVQDDLSIRDVDRVDRDRPSRAFAVGFLFLLLDQAAD
jgi:hypothetical protein